MNSRRGPSACDRAEFLQILRYSPNYVNVGIEESLLMFSEIDSLIRLKKLSSNLQCQVQDKLPTYVEKVASVLKGFTPVPNAVGLGAFVIATALQIAFNCVTGSSGSNGRTPKDMLRLVFAEEKSSEVWNLIEEYMKRYNMYLRDDHCLLQETERLEKELSLQLTRLRNSILVEQQMSSRAVKHWVNGAAFHAQMLIHIVRLKKRTGEGTQAFENAKRAASSYHNDLQKILKKYKEFKTLTLTVSLDQAWTPMVIPPPATTGFNDTETGSIGFLHGVRDRSPGGYVDYMFINYKRLKEIKVYFFNLQKNIDVLVNQIGDFQIKS